MTFLLVLMPIACDGSTRDDVDVPQWTVSTTPAIRIGDAGGAIESQFYQIRAVTRFADGAIAVANGGSAEVRIFDRVGHHVRTIGGRGNGPGEFPYLQRLLLLAGDTILAGHMNMMSRFTADGAYVDSQRLDWIGMGNITHHPETMYPLRRGVYGVMLFQSGIPADREVFNRPSVLWLVTGPASEWVDTVGLFGGIEQMSFDWGGMELTAIPTFPASTTRGIQDGMLVLGDSDTDSIVWYDARDRSRGTIRIPWRRPAISAEALRQARATSCDWASGDRHEQCTASVARLPNQTQLPFFEAAHPDAKGLIWVAQSSPSATERQWIVFTRVGRAIGRATLPATLRIMEIGNDYILAVVQDEDGVESVVEYTLTRN